VPVQVASSQHPRYGTDGYPGAPMQRCPSGVQLWAVATTARSAAPATVRRREVRMALMQCWLVRTGEEKMYEWIREPLKVI
jgi:hypothetical protein